MRPEIENADSCAVLETVPLHYTTRTKSCQKSKINFGKVENSAIQPNQTHELYAKPPRREQIRCGGSVLIQFKTARPHDFRVFRFGGKSAVLGKYDCLPISEFATSHAILGARNLRTRSKEKCEQGELYLFLLFC